MSVPKVTFFEGDPTISDDARKVFTEYSKIPEDEILKHVRTVRDKAWAKQPYPCIGSWQFLDFGIGQTPQYAEVLKRVKHGEQLLDLGCCVGQDIRKLVADGAPSENIIGFELIGEFVDLGYELFKDKTTLRSKILIGDFLSADGSGLQAKSFDMIYAGSFFHLFDWDKQRETMSSAVRLLRQKPGSMLFGRQAGLTEGRVVESPAAFSGKFFAQDDKTFRKLVGEVADETGTKLRCDVALVKHTAYPESTGWKHLLYAITLE